MNVVLITLDALRADHLGCFGYQRDTSPNLDRIGKKGILFTEAFAHAPYTTASITALLSSTLPFIPDNYFNISQREPLPVILNKHGIQTFGVHSNPWFSIYDYSAGFSKFIDPFKEGNTIKTKKQVIREKISTSEILKNSHVNRLIGNAYKKIRRTKIVRPYADAGVINNTVLTLMNNIPNKFFLWIHYMDTHEPYIPHEFVFGSKISNVEIAKLMAKFKSCSKDITPEEQKNIVNLYDNQVRYLDQKIGELLEALSKVCDFNKTLVIITSDHGQMLGERGLFGHAHKNIPLCFYDELIHVPLFIWCESIKILERISKNGVFWKKIGLIDIAPTILDIFEVDSNKKLIGQSLLRNFIEKPIISQGLECKYPNQVKYFSSGIRKHCLRTEDYKLIYSEKKCLELFDLKNDPNESIDISAKQPKVAMRLLDQLQNTLSNYKKAYEDTEQIKIKYAVEKMLRSKKL